MFDLNVTSDWPELLNRSLTFLLIEPFVAVSCACLGITNHFLVDIFRLGKTKVSFVLLHTAHVASCQVLIQSPASEFAGFLLNSSTVINTDYHIDKKMNFLQGPFYII